MENQAQIVIHIDSKTKKLSPEGYDIKEIQEILSNMNTLLSDENGHRKEVVSYKIEDGSVRHVFTTAIQKVAEFGGVLSLIASSGTLDNVYGYYAKPFNEIQRIARAHDYVVDFGTSLLNDKVLSITSDTHFEKKNLWYDTPMYFYGKLLDAGGKSDSNIHLETKDYGYIKIHASKEVLSSIKDNPLYREFAVQVNAKQDAITGEIDMKSLELVEFIDFEPRYNDAYFKEILGKSSKVWAGVDVDKYLDEIRGRA